jgi:hypothetical protein
VTSGFVTYGLVTCGFVTSGFVACGFVASGFVTSGSCDIRHRHALRVKHSVVATRVPHPPHVVGERVGESNPVPSSAGGAKQLSPALQRWVAVDAD